MRFFDTHAHFSDDSDVTAIERRANAAGVLRILAVGGSEELNRNALRTSGPVALGLDRDQMPFVEEDHHGLRRLIADNANRVAAIGETGLDFHYGADTADAQRELFARQLTLADELALPVVVHTREADDATIETLKAAPWRHSGKLRGVIHSYTGGPAFAGRLLDLGFCISFSGIATFRSADLVRESARYVPADRILVETDSPFLAPVPLRGHQCEPAFVVHTAKRIAEERHVPLEDFSEQTFLNSCSLFGLQPC